MKRAPLLLLVFALAGAAPAAPAPALRDFIPVDRHVNKGAPADVWTMATDPSGCLWLGTGFGLYRFDGLRFERYPLREGQRLRSTNINALAVLPGGDIWLGLYAGGVVRLREGEVSHFGPDQGLPPGRVLRFARTPDGSLWAAAAGGLARLQGERWARIGEDWGYEPPGAEYVFADRRGVLWVASPGQLSFLRPGERRFVNTGLRVGREAVLAEDRQGRVWVSDDLLGTRPLPDYPHGAPLSTPLPPAAMPVAGRGKQLLFASDGSLWLTQYATGLRRLREPGRIPTGQPLSAADALETFAAADGLPSNQVVPLVEDAQGQVWAGSNAGIASFRRRLVQVPDDPAGAFRHTVAMTPSGGGVMAAMARAVLLLDPPHPPRVRPNSRGLIEAAVGPDGSLWRLQADGLWRERDGHEQRMAAVDDRVLAFTPDDDGQAWVSMADAGVFHIGPQGATPEPRAMLAGATPTVIARRGPGEVWFGHDDQVIRLAQGRFSRFGPGDGLSVGRASAILFGRRAVYVAGETGLARYDGQRFTSVSAEQEDALAHVTGMVETDDGGLWLNGGRGIVHVRAADVDALFDGGPGQRAYRLLDWRHGLPGLAQQAAPRPTLIRDPSGRLWFNTNQGVAWLSPQSLAEPGKAPTAGVRGLRVGDRQYPPTPAPALPGGTRSVVLQYTAFSLGEAERTRFRYRLQGVDTDWQDGGTRREASYANLQDGDYVFQVIASQGDGAWSAEPAELRFSIAPTFLQSRWFGVGAGLALLALAWLVYALRARAIARRVRLLLEERHAERDRIARELHDTLLQSTQGLIINIQGLVSRLPREDRLRASVEAALDRADDVVLEARERVRGLRSPRDAAVEGLALVASLEGIGQDLGADKDVIFRVVCSGSPRPLVPEVAEEFLRIGREALLNAFRHAKARQIEVELSFGSASFSLSVRDDGIGIEPGVLSRGHRPGHWGLPGMQERIRALGGSLQLSSEVPAGTELSIGVAASRAYAAPPPEPGGFWARLRRRLGPGAA